MIPRRNYFPVLASLVTALVAAACSDRADEPTEPPPGAGEVTEVTLSNFAFSPASVTVDRGTTIRWRNSTSTFHTVTPDGHQVFAEWQTNTQGQTFEVRFDSPGTYRYFCSPHRDLGMTGMIVVR